MIKKLALPRVFSTGYAGRVFDSVRWNQRDVVIKDPDGKEAFRQDAVEAPESWSDRAVTIAASKYFRGVLGTDARERSVKQLVSRVVKQTAEWAHKGEYFTDEAAVLVFADELAWLLLHQMAAFNSPVWFNLGWAGRRAAVSACYIVGVEDSMESILDLYKTEGMLFRDGSGSGTNLSRLRSSRESLAAGGHSSGPVSFMRGLDASGGSIKSGGSTRRAAAIRELNDDHPDIMQFIQCKVDADRAARALMAGGFSGDFAVAGNAYDHVGYQNANHSVHATDAFMRAVEADAPWALKAVTTGEVLETLPARKIARAIAEAAHACGDPGMQFHDTMNKWHTSPSGGQIVGSNPCSEFTYIENSSCNLASTNLMKFAVLDESGKFTFDTAAYQHATRVLITAMESFVGLAAYPTPLIEKNSHDYRPLGLGYTNLGALLMCFGHPYDSPRARAWAGAITSLMSATAYAHSAVLAEAVGPSIGFSKDRDAFVRVLDAHQDAHAALEEQAYVAAPRELLAAASNAWATACEGAESGAGIRNGQVVVLAPTGTISFLMDADTTGLEPDLALVKRKRLVGGGEMRIANESVGAALQALGYVALERERILEHVKQTGTVEGAPALRDEHLAVFDCQLAVGKSGRTISLDGHIDMVAAIQPFLSGAASKTFSMPSTCTVEDVERTYMSAWKKGLKCVSVYRDGSKGSQPLSAVGATAVPEALAVAPRRRKLPTSRASVTHKFSVAGNEGYATIGRFGDGTPGELFVKMSKEGSTISGLMDSWAIMVSLSLQYGVPVEAIVRKLQHTRFDPSGFTGNPEIPSATSVVDYLVRWLEQQAGTGAAVAVPAHASAPESVRSHPATTSEAGPPCSSCGGLTQRAGSCFACGTCGQSSGCA